MLMIYAESVQSQEIAHSKWIDRVHRKHFVTLDDVQYGLSIFD
jgi:hypothetical protein